uniref:Phage protein n=1 Tax=Caenorhabditis tropicalis TaxID=1561998 RepID=A0A1I7UCX2_9PELO
MRKYLGVSQLEFDQRFTDVDIDDLFERECWIKSNCEVWKTEREAAEQEKMAQSGRYKRYKRYMKNAGTISFVDEE